MKYGVQVMPTYPGTGGGHQTISGPGQLGDLQQRQQPGVAAEKFLLWLTAPAQVKNFSLRTGDLPIRQLGGHSPGFNQQMNHALPGVSAFISQPEQRPAGPAADPAVPQDLRRSWAP